MNTIHVYLPLLSSALLAASVVLAIACRWLQKPAYRIAATLLAIAMSLIQYNNLSIAHYLAGLFGNLSFTSIILLCTFLYFRCTAKEIRPIIRRDLFRISLIIGITAIIFYPSALGASSWDLYAEGYYPVILGPTMFAIFTLGVVRNWYYLSCIIAVVFAAYGIGIFESDNLWDYLMDPLLAIFCLVRLPAAVSWVRQQISGPAWEATAMAIVGSFLLFAVFLSRTNQDAFVHQFVPEDGLLESITALLLFCVLLVCVNRLWILRSVRSRKFLGMIAFVALAGLFGAGEEISWGQRIFDWQTPEYFVEYNKQNETGLHNLVFEIDGKKLSVNKIIFGTGLALAMIIYLFVMTPLYRSHRNRGGAFSKFIDRMAIPMPENYQVLGYVVVVACVELLVDSAKRGEITEFAGSIVFLLNVTFPSNREIFDIEFQQPHT